MPPTTSYSYGDIVLVSFPFTGQLAAAKATPIKNRRLYRRLASIEKLPKRDQEALRREPSMRF